MGAMVTVNGARLRGTCWLTAGRCVMADWAGRGFKPRATETQNLSPSLLHPPSLIRNKSNPDNKRERITGESPPYSLCPSSSNSLYAPPGADPITMTV